jgi:hypothetical protein
MSSPVKKKSQFVRLIEKDKRPSRSILGSEEVLLNLMIQVITPFIQKVITETSSLKNLATSRGSVIFYMSVMNNQSDPQFEVGIHYEEMYRLQSVEAVENFAQAIDRLDHETEVRVPCSEKELLEIKRTVLNSCRDTIFPQILRDLMPKQGHQKASRRLILGFRKGFWISLHMDADQTEMDIPRESQQKGGRE